MPIEPHFLNWDEPLLWKLADFLLPKDGQGPVDLSERLVLVSTQQAGRRLREHLAVASDGDGRTLIPPRVQTPIGWLRETLAGPIASESMQRAAWIHTLQKTPMGRMQNLFPIEPESRDTGWALYHAGLLMQLRTELADGGYSVQDVVEQMGKDLPEPRRWRELAMLESDVLKRLDEAGQQDACRALLSRAAEPLLAADLSSVLLVAVPDVPSIVCRALENLSASVPVQVLIYAPEEQADFFDEFGRSLPANWPSVDELEIQVAANPADQAVRVAALLGSADAPARGGDLSVGLPDSEVIPPLVNELVKTGWKPFDPAGQPVKQHRLYLLLQSIQEFVAAGNLDAFRTIIRHADLLHWLQRSHGLSSDQVLAHWDAFYTTYLPIDADEAKRRAESIKEPTSRQQRRLGVWLHASPLIFDLLSFSDGLVDGLRSLLQTVYQGFELSRDRDDDDAFIKVAELLNETLSEWESCQQAFPELKPTSPGLQRSATGDGLQVLLHRLRDEMVTLERGDATLDMEGWLELLWSDASWLIVSGLNEGVIPVNTFGDPFLPDTLRESLGLRRDAAVLARDQYLFRALGAWRSATDGRCTSLCGKTTATGEPVRPSRILFECSDDLLADRLAHLFAEVDEPRPVLPPESIFALDPAPPEGAATEVERLTVTSFGAYLACPFRFYLHRVLGMESVSDDVMEMDALAFGSLVHGVLEAMGRDESIHFDPDEDRVITFLQDELATQANRSLGARRALQVEIQLDAARQRLRWAGRAHVEQVRQGWKIVGVEQLFDEPLAGLRVRGQIDRIDQHVETGAVRVLDYKSSDTPAAAEKAHTASWLDRCPDYQMAPIGKKGKRWTNLQLPLYHLLGPADLLAGRDVSVGYFNLPRAVQDTGLYLWEGWSAELLDSARVCAEGVIDDVVNKRFWPPAEKVDYDDFEGLMVGELEATRFKEWMKR